MKERIASVRWPNAIIVTGVVLLIGMAAGAQEAATTVWAGVYTEAQATRGEEGYLKDCAPCHRKDLYGDEYAPALVRRTFSDRWTDHSVGELYGVIRSTMPQDAPGTLPTQEYIDIISYVLKMNQMPAGRTDLPSDQAMLKQIMIRQKPRP